MGQSDTRLPPSNADDTDDTTPPANSRIVPTCVRVRWRILQVPFVLRPRRDNKVISDTTVVHPFSARAKKKPWDFFNGIIKRAFISVNTTTYLSSHLPYFVSLPRTGGGRLSCGRVGSRKNLLNASSAREKMKRPFFFHPPWLYLSRVMPLEAAAEKTSKGPKCLREEQGFPLCRLLE